MSNETYVRFFVEDGSVSLAVDVHNADMISVPKSADSVIAFDVFSVSGAPISISEHVVTLNVKKRPTDTVFIAQIEAITPPPSPSCYGRFILPRTLWSLVPAGLYVYDVLATDVLGNRTQLSSAKVFHLGQ
jgi:hypothetical protein